MRRGLAIARSRQALCRGQVGNRDAENLPSTLEASLHPVGTLGGNLATQQPAFDRSTPAPVRLPRERGARKQSNVESLAN